MSFDSFIDKRLGFRRIDDDKWEMNYISPSLKIFYILGIKKLKKQLFVSDADKKKIISEFKSLCFSTGILGGISGYIIVRIFEGAFSIGALLLVVVSVVIAFRKEFLFTKKITNMQG